MVCFLLIPRNDMGGRGSIYPSYESHISSMKLGLFGNSSSSQSNAIKIIGIPWESGG